MIKENLATCIFKNDRVIFKSFLNEFTHDLFEEFDLNAKKIGLHSKIDDLFSGEKVNFTEGLSAWHPIYLSLIHI